MSNLSPRRRRYNLCNALDLTKLSIELQKLEELGVNKQVIARWRDRARYLLRDILDVSDSLDD